MCICNSFSTLNDYTLHGVLSDNQSVKSASTHTHTHTHTHTELHKLTGIVSVTCVLTCAYLCVWFSLCLSLSLSLSLPPSLPPSLFHMRNILLYLDPLLYICTISLFTCSALLVITYIVSQLLVHTRLPIVYHCVYGSYTGADAGLDRRGFVRLARQARARRARPRGVLGHAPPETFWISDLLRSLLVDEIHGRRTCCTCHARNRSSAWRSQRGV